MKRLVLLQILGCIVFAIVTLILNHAGELTVFSAILTYCIMGIGSIINAYFLLMKPIEEVGIHDKLTGCFNRVHLEKTAKEYEEFDTCAVIFFDLNYLKRTNDKHGHEVGDKLLIEAANELRSLLSYGDLYRIGGDEFVIIVPDIAEDEVTKILDDWFNNQPVLNANYDDDFECKFSYGLCIKNDKTSFREAIKKADKNMYELKKAMKVTR